MESTLYDGLTREELVRKLAAYEAAAAAPKGVADSINLLETIHLAQTDYVTVDSQTNIFNQMLDNFLTVTGCEYGFIDEMFEEENGSRYLEARAITNIAWDDASRALYEELVSGEIRFDNLKSLCGVAMISGEPVISNDAPNDPRRTGIPPGHPPLDTFLGLPLHAAGEYVGMVGLANAPGGFDEALIESLEPLTKICAIIMLSLKIDRRRAQAIERLERRTEELRVSNEELQTFAYVASHDLQTPLRSISGFVQLLQADYGGKIDEKADGWIKHTVDATRRMQSLISDLLEYSRVGASPPEFSDVPLDEVLDTVLGTLQVEIDDMGATVTREALPTVRGDRVQLEQVLQNLVGNGVKYRGEAPPEVHIGAALGDDGWTVSVRDNGIGIADRHQGKVFEVFKRLHTQAAYPGSGVGLAVCRRVVRHHGGRIWLDSAEQQGSTFRFTIPGAPDGQEAADDSAG